jgi:hypothetical protein
MVTWDGLTEFARALKALPEQLATASQAAVKRAADTTMSEVLSGYPLGPTGGMRAGVLQVTHDQGVVFGVDVRSTAPEAHLWEYGTTTRATHRGANRGYMRAHQSDSLHAIGDRARAAMNSELQQLVADAGFTVVGDFNDGGVDVA